jgi:hypothetical protein
VAVLLEAVPPLFCEICPQTQEPKWLAKIRLGYLAKAQSIQNQNFAPLRLCETFVLPPNLMLRFSAFLLVAVVIGLIALYVREFTVFARTLEVFGLVVGSMIAGLLLIGAGIFGLRRRLQPWERHGTELALVAVFGMLFAPLLGSLLNRATGPMEYRTFDFVSETPYMTAGYGVLKGEKIQSTGYRLRVREGERVYRLRYKKQAYFPLNRPGDTISLPVRVGLFGVRVLELE